MVVLGSGAALCAVVLPGNVDLHSRFLSLCRVKETGMGLNSKWCSGFLATGDKIPKSSYRALAVSVALFFSDI